VPSFEQVAGDAVLYAHASRILHLEANPEARPLVQRTALGAVAESSADSARHADMDAVYELPYARRPHPPMVRRRFRRTT